MAKFVTILFSSWLLTAWAVFGQTYCFTLPFVTNAPPAKLLSVHPVTNQSVFVAGQVITISNSAASLTRVMDVRCNVVTQHTGAAFSMALPANHYFVETDGDRCGFVVLPGVGVAWASEDASKSSEGEKPRQRVHSVAPGWVRIHDAFQWRLIQTNAGGAFLWANGADQMARFATNYNVHITLGLHPAWATNTPSSYVSNWVAYAGAVAGWLQTNHPSANVLLEIESEPTAFRYSFMSPTPWQTVYTEIFTQSVAVIKAIYPQAKIAAFNSDNFRGYLSAFQLFRTNGVFASADYMSWQPDWLYYDPPDEDTPSGTSTNYGAYKETVLLRGWGITNRLMVGETYFPARSSLGILEPPMVGTGGGDLFNTSNTWTRGAYRAAKAIIGWRAGGVELVNAHVARQHYYGTNLTNDNYSIYGYEYEEGANRDSRGVKPVTSYRLATAWWLRDGSASVVDMTSTVRRVVWTNATAETEWVWSKENTTNSLSGVWYDVFGQPYSGNLVDEPVWRGTGQPVPPFQGTTAMTNIIISLLLVWSNPTNYNSVVVQQADGSNGTAFVQIASLPLTNSFRAGSLATNSWYTFRVAGVVGGKTSAWSNAAIGKTRWPPAFTLQPQSAVRYAGESVTFAVTLTGQSPITLQWRKNGVNIAGATGLTYTIDSVQVSDAAVYDCMATNPDAVSISQPATLSVLVVPSPQNLQVIP